VDERERQLAHLVGRPDVRARAAPALRHHLEAGDAERAAAACAHHIHNAAHELGRYPPTHGVNRAPSPD
jgi:DNA-binding GntR family transcriptional regulator